jgi:hypothetical protein
MYYAAFNITAEYASLADPKLSRHSQAHFQLHSKTRSQHAGLSAPKYAFEMLSSTLQTTLSNTLPIALNGTLPACLTVPSQVSSLDTLKHTPTHAAKYTLQSEDNPNLTSLYICMYAPGCSNERLAEFQVPSINRKVH